MTAPLSLFQTKRVTRPGLTVSFAAQGGTAPYSYAVKQGDVAGGTVDPTNGLYTAPNSVPQDSRDYYDYVVATDATGATAEAWISVGHFWQLVAEIFRFKMSLPLKRIYLFNQNVEMPKDDKPFVIIQIPGAKAMGSGVSPAGPAGSKGGPGWSQAVEWVETCYHMDLHLYSRSTDALHLLPAMQLAASSIYSQQVQQANSLYLANQSPNIVNLSSIDGTDIPYHYVMSLDAYYTNQRTLNSDYLDTFQELQIVPQA